MTLDLKSKGKNKIIAEVTQCILKAMVDLQPFLTKYQQKDYEISWIITDSLGYYACYLAYKAFSLKIGIDFGHEVMDLIAKDLIHDKLDHYRKTLDSNSATKLHEFYKQKFREGLEYMYSYPSVFLNDTLQNETITWNFPKWILMNCSIEDDIKLEIALREVLQEMAKDILAFANSITK